MPSKQIILTAWAEPASGPGWTNSPLYYLVSDFPSEKLHVECVQSEEQSAAMKTLYVTSAAASDSMRQAVERYLEYKK